MEVDPTDGTPGFSFQGARRRADIDETIELAGLIKEELVGRNEDREYCVIEPFVADWLRREQRDHGVTAKLRSP